MRYEHPALQCWNFYNLYQMIKLYIGLDSHYKRDNLVLQFWYSREEKRTDCRVAYQTARLRHKYSRKTIDIMVRAYWRLHFKSLFQTEFQRHFFKLCIPLFRWGCGYLVNTRTEYFHRSSSWLYNQYANQNVLW